MDRVDVLSLAERKWTERVDFTLRSLSLMRHVSHRIHQVHPSVHPLVSAAVLCRVAAPIFGGAMRCVRVSVSANEGREGADSYVLFAVRHERADSYVLRRYTEFETVRAAQRPRRTRFACDPTHSLSSTLPSQHESFAVYPPCLTAPQVSDRDGGRRAATAA